MAQELDIQGSSYLKSYEYDDLDRLTSSTRYLDFIREEERFTYDDNGNFLGRYFGNGAAAAGFSLIEAWSGAGVVQIISDKLDG